MALKPLQGALYPLGQFDGYDTELTSFLGGEVCTLVPVERNTGDLAAKDVSDGYSGTTLKTRPAVSKILVSGARPLFLADEGTSGYGTLFGRVVGGTAGQVTLGAQLGPHTATGSGKVTLWQDDGMYAVTLDAVDSTSGTGLNPDNASLQPGTALYATTAGLLTPDAGSAFEAVVVARFMEFGTQLGSLVRTPASLVSALNSPVGLSSTYGAFTEAVIHFRVED